LSELSHWLFALSFYLLKGTAKMSKELKPCPFCGGEDTEIDPDGHGGWFVGCLQCNYELYLPNCTEYEAARRWSNRPVEDALTAELTRYRIALCRLEGDCIYQKNFASSDEEKLFLNETLSHIGEALDFNPDTEKGGEDE
jgi:hypothetical protein